jgi:hypothetical protein
MKLDVYRKLYLANRGVLQAVHVLHDLSHVPGCNRRVLKEIQSVLEENRALMNRNVAEVIEQKESRKAGRFPQHRQG